MILVGQRRGLLEFAIVVFLSLAAATAGTKLGFDFALLAALVFLGVLTAIVAPPIYICLLILAAPLPSVGAFIGAEIPVGLDPFTVLLVGGMLVAARSATRWPRPPAMTLLIAAFASVFFIYAVAWYRTYASGGVSPQDLALLVKPVFLALSGAVVPALLPREQLLPAVANGLLVALGLVAASIVLQAAGIYESAYQAENFERLGIKQFGGLLLQGNSAGALFAVYAVPTFLLLRATGRRYLGITLLVVTPAILFITLSRTAFVAFGASILLFMVYDRNRVRNAVIAIGVFGATAAWAMTAARSAFEGLTFSVSGPSSTNVILSGRVDIWEQAQIFLRQGNHFLVGGGLDAFQDFAGRSSLGNEFATHSAVLFLLTTGGLVLLGAYAVLLVSVWLVSSRMLIPVRAAVRIALLALVVFGVANDATLIARMGSWTWLLLGVGIYLSTDAAAARSRSAIAATS